MDECEGVNPLSSRIGVHGRGCLCKGDIAPAMNVIPPDEDEVERDDPSFCDECFSSEEGKHKMSCSQGPKEYLWRGVLP